MVYFPVRLGLQTAVGIGGAGINVIGKHDPVAYEYFILNIHAFANESVRGNLAARAYADVFLDFHKGAYFALVANAAAV